MSSLQSVSFEDIENKVMLILHANSDKVFTKSELYNKVLDNYNSDNHYVDPQFKYRYMIILNQLGKYDVKVTNNLITLSKEPNTELKEVNDSSMTELPSMEDVSEYIVENNLINTSGYNGLPFDLVRGNKLLMVEKMLEGSDHILFFNKINEDNKTPLRFIGSQQMTNLFLEKLYNKVSKLERENLELYGELGKLQKQINEQKEMSIYNFLNNKVTLFLKNNETDINNVLSIIVIIGLLRSNQNTIHLFLFLYLVFCCVGLIYNKIFSKY